jgi:hypothetical protein
VTPPGRAAGVRPASDELIGELAHELSLLIRSDVELSALERGPLLRSVAVELGVALLAGLVLLLSLAAIGWAAILGLANVVPRGIAALLVAAGWAVVAALLLRIGPPRRLWRRLTRETHEERVLAARHRRTVSERAVRDTAAHLGRAIMHEARERELHAAASAAERAGAAAQRALDVPARAGRSVLEKFRGPSEP